MQAGVRLAATDEVYIDAPRATVARALLDLSDDHAWWPGARVAGGYGWLSVDAPSGRGRARFTVSVGEVREWDGFGWELTEGPLRGRVEFWFEQFGDGTIVHCYLDAQKAPGGIRRGGTRVRVWRWTMRRCLNDLKDRLERVRSAEGIENRR